MVHSTNPFTDTLQHAVGFFPRLQDAEYAITDLKSVGFPLEQVSLVAQNFQRTDYLGEVHLCDRFETTHLKIPAEQIRSYHDRLADGQHMMIVQGSEDDLNRAASILSYRDIQDWQIHRSTSTKS